MIYADSFVGDASLLEGWPSVSQPDWFHDRDTRRLIANSEVFYK